MRRSFRNRYRMLLVVFFLSGFSGLVYQVVWFRMLALIFGVTSYALGIVLAAFMGGLAIGGFGGGWLAQRSAQPLRTYALTEIGIGLLALCVPWMLESVQAAYVTLAPGLSAHPGWLAALRFTLAFGTLLAPTIGMGATLPLLAAAVASPERAAQATGRLYAANTAGAVIGTLAAGFLLIGLLGLRASIAIAALLNIGTGAYLLMVSRDRRPRPGVPAKRPQPHYTRARLGDFSAPLRIAGLSVFVISGLAALAYEVIWTRLFSVLALGLVYGFTLMLATLLAGIAVGSAAYSRWLWGRQGAASHLAWCQFAIGTVVASSPLWLVPLAGNPAASALQQWPLVGELAARCSNCVIMLPAMLALVFGVSVLYGAAFPAAVRLCAGPGPDQAGRMGRSYAANVVGGLIGSLAAGFWLLPSFGAQSSLLALSALNLISAIALAGVGRRFIALVAMIPIALAVLTGSWVGRTKWDLYQAFLGASRLGPSRVLWFHEGVESSVAVAEWPSGALILLINGEIHGFSKNLKEHRLIGHLGPLLHPLPEEILVIGLGAGTSAGTMSLYPGTRVTVVELSKGVVKAARLFQKTNYAVQDQPNVNWIVDDGRNWMLVSGRRYDVIQADVLEARHAGASVVYSREYFELVRRALKPKGVAVQWLGGPGSLEYAWVRRTFESVFPHVTFWIGGSVAVGSNEPQPPLDPARFAQLAQVPSVRRALAEVHLERFEDVLQLRLPSASVGRAAGPIVTDDHPCLEYFLTLPILSGNSGDIYENRRPVK